MDNNDLTPKHILAAFLILFVFVLMAWRGEVAATGRSLYARRIEATQREIDALVYHLYGLTGDQIELIEA